MMKYSQEVAEIYIDMTRRHWDAIEKRLTDRIADLEKRLAAAQKQQRAPTAIDEAFDFAESVTAPENAGTPLSKPEAEKLAKFTFHAHPAEHFAFLYRLILNLHNRNADRIEKSGLRYKGVYQTAMQYKRGDFVTRDGSMWHCNADGTTETPGSGNGWQLAVKAGKDAR
jgi:hypothetical protein